MLILKYCLIIVAILPLRVWGCGGFWNSTVHVDDLSHSPHYVNDAYYLYTKAEQVEAFYQDHPDKVTQLYWSCARVLREKDITVDERARVGRIIAAIMKEVENYDQELYAQCMSLLDRRVITVIAENSSELAQEYHHEIARYASLLYGKPRTVNRSNTDQVLRFNLYNFVISFF